MKDLSPNQKQYTPFSAIMQKNLMDLLTKSARSPYANSASAKSEAECGSSNTLAANSSTPLTRAFFVRSSRTPKERQNKACSAMVACSGQGFALDCLPLVTAFHPVTRYHQITVESEVIALNQLLTELSKMKAFAYSFLCAIRTPETDTYQETVVRIIANSEVNARLQLTADYRLLLPRPVAKIRLNSTACTVKGGIYA
ncbi:TPA: ash family protein [Mannheimia haemolytica]